MIREKLKRSCPTLPRWWGQVDIWQFLRFCRSKSVRASRLVGQEQGERSASHSFEAAALLDRGTVGARSLVRGLSALSLRQIEEVMAERGVVVDRATIHRWSIKMMPALAAVFRRRKRPVGASWRMDETYITVNGEWKCLYRAVDRAGHTILLRAHRDLAAARCFFERAIDLHGVPEKITIDKSGANTAAIVGIRAEAAWTSRCGNRITSTIWSSKIIAGIKTIHMIKRGQLDFAKDRTSPAADKFYSLAF